jgi:hypothetical protein
MSEITWALIGFSIGSLISSFFLRKEKIRTVIVLLTVLWLFTFLVEFIIYLGTVNPAPPEELNVLGGITLMIVLILFISEFFQKRREK